MPINQSRVTDRPSHPQFTYQFTNGQEYREGPYVLPLYHMEHFRQYCKYCYRHHSQWWMMDQRDYCITGLTIILCGNCEHTSAQDHETRQHHYRHPTAEMIAEAIANFKMHGKSSENVVSVKPQVRLKTQCL
jgi:hypothetical protein